MLEFKLPEVGENIKSGNVVSILVSAGDTVKKDQDLLELETDKASLPVPSPCDGVIKEILIKEGQDVNIGSVVMKIEPTAADSVKTIAAQTKTAKTEVKPVPQKQTEPQKPSPKYQPASAAETAQTATAVLTKSNEDIPAQVDVPAAPAVRRLARELGIEVSQVPGTGPAGRISKDDVKAFVKKLITTGAGVSKGPEIRPLPDFSKWGNTERQAMNNVRKKTAEHLSYCWQTIPHVTQFDKADITELEKLRKDRSTDKMKLTITPFLLQVMAAALKEFPQFNASIDMQKKEIIYKKYYHLGVAVDTNRGLLVPVIRDVDRKSIPELAEELGQIAERARNRKTSLEELQGGCMSLTNLGGIGGTSFTPIVNWPEVAILGISRGGWEQSYVDGKFVARFKLPLSLSYDHRIIDGADGARFLRWVCERIEQTASFKL